MKKLIVLILVTAISLHVYALDNSTISSWAESEITLALDYKLLKDVNAFSDYGAQITRLQMCGLIVDTYELMRGKPCGEPVAENIFTDTNDRRVLQAAELKIVFGDQFGAFEPLRVITREEAAVMLTRLLNMCDIDCELDIVDVEDTLGEYLDADLVSYWAINDIAFMIRSGYMVGTDMRILSPKGNITIEQSVILLTRVYLKNNPEFSFDGEEIIADLPPEVSNEIILPRADDGTYATNNRAEIFTEGEITSREEAEAQMVEIVIDVWNIDANGEKYPAKRYITVHKNMAARFQAVFDEIFNGPEKFPIKNVGGFSWRTGRLTRLSEHNTGTAVDINWEENYCIYSDGSIVGKYYKPGEDPYSIVRGGDVWNAFVKYGFTWGGDAWRKTRDYMHFSYFGT
ncbi:MAG: M15 family metallopeptidase [Clostridia bacterium]|nr:M15 family metallopeptidase [Clostridia bacterium]